MRQVNVSVCHLLSFKNLKNYEYFGLETYVVSVILSCIMSHLSHTNIQPEVSSESKYSRKTKTQKENPNITIKEYPHETL